MIYREAGQFKTSYPSDQAIFPIPQDRWAVIAILLFAFLVIPIFGDHYILGPIMTQFLVFSLAAIGLNLLTGYAGQISLGTGGFMAVGAYACYNLALRLPEIPLVIDFILAGGFAALVGVFFGLPSLRIKGFYLAVATLAAQFFLTWIFDHVGWFTNYDSAGMASAPARTLFGTLAVEGGPLSILAPINIVVSGPASTVEVKYLVTLSVVAVLALLAKNIVRSATGRSWMAIRDMDIAAELIGFRPFQTKLLAFSVSSFYIGIASALTFSMWLGSVETAEAFDINVSFQVLFMIIIGGLGSMLGSFLGAAFILLTPIILTNVMVQGMGFQAVTAKHFEIIFFGSLIIFFLIVEPLGLARLWQIIKEKLRQWPFPY